jgi:multimeric flavodoxin WrbA
MIPMNTLILDGSAGSDPTAAILIDQLTDALRACGGDVRTMHLNEMKIARCQGDFFCWIRQPGVCAIDDDNRVVTQAYIQSDLVVFLTPISFGGYGSGLKYAVDHLIPLIMPYFTQIQGEVHHSRRYQKYPRLLAIGWLPRPDSTSKAVFHHLVQRNAINFHAPVAISGVIYAGEPVDEIHSNVKTWLEAVLGGKSQPQRELPAFDAEPIAPGDPPKSALLLVGSPRGATSCSQALGDYLLEKLALQGIQTERVRLYTLLNSARHKASLFSKMDASNLVVLAFPLYIDSVPAPVTSILEEYAAHRGTVGEGRNPRFVALVNSGFPEAYQNQTALAICRNFARQTGLEWAGGLALGGGQVLAGGTPLGQLNGPAIPVRRSLEIAARALAEGKPVPDEALTLMAGKSIPAWLLQVFGSFAWKNQASQYNAQHHMGDRPYLVK